MLILFTYTNKKIPVKYYFTGIYLLIEAERQALEPTLSRNIIKLQITDNHILSKVQSKSKSF